MAGGAARADVTRCSSGTANVAYSAMDLQEMDGDTGWFPQGYDAQLRITGRVTGQTNLAMGLSPTACWPDQMSVTAPGVAQSGLLDSEYGAELHLFGQINTTVLGISINWSGEIPIPFLPTDLLLAGTTNFDPAMLPDSKQSSVSVSDTTSQIKVISTDVLSDIIAVTGITGGLSVYVQGQMTTTYSTGEIDIGASAITSDTGSIAVTTPPGGYAATLALPVVASGVVVYAPSLLFNIAFDVRIFGITVVSYQLASIALPLSAIDRPVMLTGDGVTLPLPHLDAAPVGLGFASGAVQTLALHNSGAAPLMLELATGPDGVTAVPTTIAAGADGTVQITASDTGTVASAPLVLATNDPNHASLSLTLDPSTSGQTNSDDPTTKSGGCAAGGGAGGLPMVALGLVFAIRRRRLRARF